MTGNKDPVARRRPMAMILIAVAFAIAATVAFLLYDANRPPVLRSAPPAASAAG